MVAMRAWWQSVRLHYAWYSEGQKRSARSGFLRGFASGVGSRIAESRRTLIAESGIGTDVILADRKQRTDAVADALVSGTARRRGTVDALAYRQGHHSGRQANTGTQRAVPTARG